MSSLSENTSDIFIIDNVESEEQCDINFNEEKNCPPYNYNNYKKHICDEKLKPEKQNVTKTKYICDTCGCIFKNKSSLNIHVRTHITKESFICPICNKGGYLRFAL